MKSIAIELPFTVSPLKRVANRIGAAALAFCVATGSASAERYLLTANTRLSIKTFQFNASKGEYVPWDALSGEYTVSQTGTITLPIVGTLTTNNLDAGGLAPALLNQLQGKVSLLSPANI
jgi:polysaccharide export outer membrane protein